MWVYTDDNLIKAETYNCNDYKPNYSISTKQNVISEILTVLLIYEISILFVRNLYIPKKYIIDL